MGEVRANVQEMWTRIVVRSRGPQRMFEGVTHESALSSPMTLPTLSPKGQFTRDTVEPYGCPPEPREALDREVRNGDSCERVERSSFPPLGSTVAHTNWSFPCFATCTSKRFREKNLWRSGFCAQ